VIALVFLVQTLRIAVPYLFAAAGGVVSERSGIIALQLEGMMLGGAFGATVGAYWSGSAWVGVLTGVVGGLLFGAIHALATVHFRANQVVVGIAVNLLAIGATRFFLRLAFDSSSNSPRVAGFTAEQTGSGLVALFMNPLFWLAVVAFPAVAWMLDRTAFGLRVRAAGEHPEAAVSVGVPVRRVQWTAVLLSGALAGLGGVYLALDQHQFTDSMTAGRGFIAIAAVIFGRWEPRRVAIACLLFAAAEALQIQLQGSGAIPSQFVAMIPYVLTIVALAGVVGRAVQPAALGRAEE
jgi:simple sugar transport system permease protein